MEQCVMPLIQSASSSIFPQLPYSQPHTNNYIHTVHSTYTTHKEAEILNIHVTFKENVKSFQKGPPETKVTHHD